MNQQNDIKWAIDSERILTLTLDACDQSVNTLNGRFRQSLALVLERIERERDQIKGIILTSAKSSFMAGGDLNEMRDLSSQEAAQLFETIESLKKSFRTLETLGIPVVAALTGTTLGGGFELALACHHRLALQNKESKIGLPEVSLGLMPGAGGVVRLVRLLGLEKALPLLVEGKTLSTAKALEQGLIDGLCVSIPGMHAQAKQWILEQTEIGQRFEQKKWRIPGGTPREPSLAEKLPVIPAMLIDKTKGVYPAPEAILNTAVNSLYVDLDTALRIESRAFVKLATGPVARNMLQSFWFQLNSIKQGTYRGDDRDYPPFKKVAILGAGMMGAGIAFSAAKAGFSVYLKDRSLEMAQKGKEYSEKILADRLAKGVLSQEEKDRILSRIIPVSSYQELESCDLVIEAVFEDRLIKKDVTESTLAIVGPHTVFASNTSTLPITSLAAASPRPDQFIGLHFFSPVDKMQLVEVIKGSKTSAQTVARAFDFVRHIDKVPIVVNDSRGFYTSRVFGTFTQEGMILLGEGQNPAAIERAAMLAGMPVGPLAVSDEVSLTLFELVQKATEHDFKSQGQSYQEPPSAKIVHRMIHEFGRKGKAHGAGFYEYPKEGKKFLWPELTQVFKGKAIPFEDIKDRLIFIQVIETVRALEEKVLRSVAEANLGSIFGFGFVPASGGTLQYINSYGIKAFTNRAWELARLYGPRFEPPRTLIERTEKCDLFV
jgi:3-hydroxyacyl-CoA dehydrogenase/enoyl-CoA hydratase/3-hydroxybutyryl-CoA epimerase